MSDENSNPFRERLEIKAEGMLVEAPRPKGPKGLVVSEESFDLERDFSDLVGKPKELPGAAEVVLDKEGFTVEDVEVGKLDDALRALQQQQSDEQIRELVERAMQLIDEQDYPAALSVLEEAREIAPTSVSVLYLMAVCVFSEGRFEDAYDVLAEARQHVGDSGDLLLPILALQDACLRVIVGGVEDQLAALRKSGRDDAALRLVEESLQRYPANVTLLYQRCAILIRLGRAEQARRAAQQAVEEGGEENADFFRQMLEQASLLEYRPLLEPARQALRAGDAARAAKLLKACRDTLHGLPLYETACAYAREKDHTPPGLSIFSRKKEQPSSLAGEPLQHTLRWLLSDELDAAYDAMDKRDHAAAISHLRRAAGIDSRCGQINYLHGLALYRIFLGRLGNQDEALNLEQCARELKAAARYVQDASADPPLAERGRVLGAAIKSYLDQVDELLREYARREREARPVRELLNRYNDYMDYLDRTPVGTMKVWTAAREKFLGFRQQADALRRDRGKEQGREVLDQLVEALDHHLKSLDEMRGDVQKYSLVNECLDEYKALGVRYGRTSTFYYSELLEAKARVNGLLTKLGRARASLGYDANSDAGAMSSLHDFVVNWQPGRSLDPGQTRTKPPHVDQRVWDNLNTMEESLKSFLKDLENARRG